VTEQEHLYTGSQSANCCKKTRNAKI